MRLKALTVAAAIAAGAAFTPQIATAAALPGATAPQSQKIAASSLLEEVRYRGWNRCRRVRQNCAFRFGWRSWSYRRCVIRRGC